MSSRTFEYVPSFDMDTAIFDDHREFYNAYRRSKECSAGTGAIGYLADGKVTAAWSTGAARACPFVMYTTGELLLDSCDQPEKRGRYTFSGFDFSVISTTNDRYGAIAMRHMSGPSDLGLKINAAALSMSPSGESREGQTLLIDHVTDWVYSLGRNYDPEGTTSDGVDRKVMWHSLPEQRRKEGPRVYIPEVGALARPSQSIRVTQMIRDSAYKDTIAACLAWYKMEGSKPMNEYYNAAAKLAGRMNVPGIYSRVEHDVLDRGFVAMSDYDRARAATINATKALPRKPYMLYRLRFDSAAFWNDIREAIAPTTKAA